MKRISPRGNVLNRNITQEMLDNIIQFEKNNDSFEISGNLKNNKDIANKDDFKIIMNQAFGSPIMKTERSQSIASSNASDSDSPSTPATPEESNAPLVETCTRIMDRGNYFTKLFTGFVDCSWHSLNIFSLLVKF